METSLDLFLEGVQTYRQRRLDQESCEALDLLALELERQARSLQTFAPGQVRCAREVLQDKAKQLVSELLRSDGWTFDEEERVFWRQVSPHMRLGGVLQDDGTIVLFGPPDSIGRLTHVDKLGRARGLEPIANMLVCIRVEFGAEPCTLTESMIRTELHRRRSSIESLDPRSYPLQASWMCDVCSRDEFISWVERIERSDPRRARAARRELRSSEVSCFSVCTPRGQRFEPVLSSNGTLSDESSSIFSAPEKLFLTAREAREWARERADQPLAYYRLHPDFIYKFSGKVWGKYSAFP